MADELPASQEQRPPRRGWTSLLDDEQVGVAAAAVRAILEDSIRQPAPAPADTSGTRQFTASSSKWRRVLLRVWSTPNPWRK
jgi:hypothetical protein